MKTRKPRRKNLSHREADIIRTELALMAQRFDLSITTLGNICHALGRGNVNVKRKEG